MIGAFSAVGIRGVVSEYSGPYRLAGIAPRRNASCWGLGRSVVISGSGAISLLGPAILCTVPVG